MKIIKAGAGFTEKYREQQRTLESRTAGIKSTGLKNIQKKYILYQEYEPIASEGQNRPVSEDGSQIRSHYNEDVFSITGSGASTAENERQFEQGERGTGQITAPNFFSKKMTGKNCIMMKRRNAPGKCACRTEEAV